MQIEAFIKCGESHNSAPMYCHCIHVTSDPHQKCDLLSRADKLKLYVTAEVTIGPAPPLICGKHLADFTTN